MTKQVIFLLYLISDFVGVKYFFIQTKLVIMSFDIEKDNELGDNRFVIVTHADNFRYEFIEHSSAILGQKRTDFRPKMRFAGEYHLGPVELGNPAIQLQEISIPLLNVVAYVIGHNLELVDHKLGAEEVVGVHHLEGVDV